MMRHTRETEAKRHEELSDREVREGIRNGSIVLGANASLRIYGRLDCRTGRTQMMKKNRVFLSSERQALEVHGFRPCGHCMRDDFRRFRGIQEADGFAQVAAAVFGDWAAQVGDDDSGDDF